VRKRERFTSIVRSVSGGPIHVPVPQAAALVRFPIVGESVELRPFLGDDVDAMWAVYGDPEVMRWVGYGAVASRDAVRSMLQQYMAHQRLHGFAFWAVVDRATGRVIGDGGLARTVGGEIEMGYTLAREFWGQGRGTQVAGLVASTALEVIGAPMVRALVEPGNARSQHVLQKLGFAEVGVTVAFGRPHRVFVRRADDRQLRAAGGDFST
jgi:ribosomal-protein-alanine N-acetyltransferase